MRRRAARDADAKNSLCSCARDLRSRAQHKLYTDGTGTGTGTGRPVPVPVPDHRLPAPVPGARYFVTCTIPFLFLCAYSCMYLDRTTDRPGHALVWSRRKKSQLDSTTEPERGGLGGGVHP